jgi:hypothetical protein
MNRPYAGCERALFRIEILGENMFFEDVIRLDNTVTHTTRQQFTGTFHTYDKHGAGDLELILSDRGILTGSLILEEITFGIKGQFSLTGLVLAYLLEPNAALPVAMLRIKSYSEGLSIDICVPELDELLGETDSEAVLFSRVVATPSGFEELLVRA